MSISPRCSGCRHAYKWHVSGVCIGGKNCPCLKYERPLSSVRTESPKRNARRIMPKCKHCMCSYKRHRDDTGLLCYRCIECPGYEPKRKTRSDKKPRGTRDSDLGRAKRTLWAKFRAYVYRRDGNVCFTCDRVLTDEDIRAGKRQAGHMFPGRTGALLYDPLVVFVQDAHCNKGLCGNTPEFVRRYVDRFGIAQFQAAVARTSRDKQWRTHEVRELIAALNRDPSGAEYESIYMEKHGL